MVLNICASLLWWPYISASTTFVTYNVSGLTDIYSVDKLTLFRSGGKCQQITGKKYTEGYLNFTSSETISVATISNKVLL